MMMKISKNRKRKNKAAKATEMNAAPVIGFGARPRRVDNLKSELVTIKTVGIPDRLRVWLKFADNTAWNNTGTIMQVYRTNSVFDPNFTGAGGQPRYFDQWSAMYGTYCVLHCDVRHSIVNTSTTIPFTVCTGFTDADPTGTSMANLSEFRYARVRGQVGIASSQPTRVYSMGISTHTLHGKANDVAVLATDTLQSAVTTNPSDPGFYFLAIQSYDDGVSTATAYVRTEIWYLVEFYSPLNTSSSVSLESDEKVANSPTAVVEHKECFARGTASLDSQHDEEHADGLSVISTKSGGLLISRLAEELKHELQLSGSSKK